MSEPDDAMLEAYIGDGLYVSFDGWQFTLRAPREHGDHFVVLEPKVLKHFNEFVDRTLRELTKRALDAKKAPPAEAGG